MWCCTDHRRWNKENGIPSLNQWSEIPKFLFKNTISKVGEYKFLDLFPRMSHFVSLFLPPPVTLTPVSIYLYYELSSSGHVIEQGQARRGPALWAH